MRSQMRSEQPAYVRAQEAILEIIEAGALGPGDQIPSERELSTKLGLSRMTVRKAIEHLMQRGTLERDSTRGTHVARPKVLRPLDSARALSMTEIVRGSGAEPGSRLLSFASADAGRQVAEDLGIVPGTKVLTFVRLRTANGIPFCIETSEIPAAFVPGLVAADLVEAPSLYALLRERYGIRVGQRRYRISVARIEASIAKHLQLDPESQTLRLESVIADQSGRPIERLVSINHPERVTFVTEAEVAQLAS